MTVDPHLEREYDVRKLRADFDDIGKEWSQRSQALRSRANCSLDIVYGPGEKQRLDLFYSGRKGAPLLAFIHGGYWQRGDKLVYSFVAEPFLEQGINVCLIGYTLCPLTNLPGITREIRRAVAWIWTNSETLDIDRGALHLAGHSAGGHLTAMMVATQWGGIDPGFPATLLRSAIPMSGLFDLRPLMKTTISHPLGLDEASVREQSPSAQLPRSDTPTLVVLGARETREFHRQSEGLLASWKGSISRLDYYAEPEVDHFDLLNRMADGRSELFRRMVSWMETTSFDPRMD